MFSYKQLQIFAIPYPVEEVSLFVWKSVETYMG